MMKVRLKRYHQNALSSCPTAWKTHGARISRILSHLHKHLHQFVASLAHPCLWSRFSHSRRENIVIIYRHVGGQSRGHACSLPVGEHVLNGDRIKREVHVAETLKKGTRVTGVDRSKLA